jgi:phenylpropionate dioxygenase-like ring-hydroxylating dioxygenase large terminal subunit
MDLTATATEGVTAASAGTAPAFVRDLWYFALLSRDVKAGKLLKKTLLGEPIVFGRAKDGAAFALRDLCPHRGVPLSAGKMQDDTVECPYHGWRFGPDGGCRLIPSLVPEQTIDASRIRVRRYHLTEKNGLIWIYMPTDERLAGEPPEGPPDLPLDPAQRPGMVERQLFPCPLDHAVVGLMDPAHGPFVHNVWWWRKPHSIHAKAKKYGPSRRGFTMLPHAPSKNAGLYKLIGGRPVTEIVFELPGLRYEIITAGTSRVFGFTACTPLTATETEVTQVFFWNMGWAKLLRPFLQPIARIFLGQDRQMVTVQQEGMKHDPRLMLIRDADVPAMWYFRIKKEWAAAQAENRPFVNPVSETTLHWRS